ncbi:MAG: hypothetical protein A2Y12_13465 [Planctomycetes bacterium GWF2_42_9]|nr:MAG: hypothetical protein A2Y12_13465 [Planctomycetes bacterium GWF2_42_9]
MSKISPVIYDMARRLIAFEASQSKSSNPNANAVALVCDKLRIDLAKLAGSAGFASLLSRALQMAKAKEPALKDVEVRADGTLDGIDMIADTGDNGGIILVAQFLELLVTFVGAPFTGRVVHGIWPQIPADTTYLKDEERS